jgi:CRP-like cAMP-binding protein
MNTSNILDAFRASAICRDLDDAAVVQLFALAEPFSVPAGSRLVRQGEAARGAYLIGSGVCEARVTLPGGGERPVATFAAGAMFGEMALLDQGLCSASVFAATDATGWFVERAAFRALAAGRNAAALAIARHIALGLVSRLGALNAELLKQSAAEDRRVTTLPPDGDPLAAVPRTPAGTRFEYRAFLPLLPFFAGFSQAEIDSVMQAASVLRVERGQWLFTAGRPAAACFLVVRGAVEACAHRDGVERRMAVLGPGSLIGYLSVLGSGRHGANARVRESAVLLEYPAATFMHIFSGTSGAEAKMQQAIQRALLGSLARSNSQLSRLVTQHALGAALRARALQAAI